MSSGKKSNPKITTETDDLTNARTCGFDADHIFSYRGYPISAAQVEHMTQELYTYSEDNPTSYHISDFYHKRMVSKSSYYLLLEKYPKLKQAHGICMEKLGEKLWARSIEKKLDYSAVKGRLHRYNSDFQEDQKIQARIAADAKAQADADLASKGESKIQYVVVRDPVYVEVEQKKPEYSM
jgi:hypothetical protein